MTETVLMIHGMWGSGAYWENWANYFEDRGFHCLRANLRHHGGDPAAPPHPELGTTSLLDYAQDLEEEIRRLASPPIIIGHSMGGLLAQIPDDLQGIERHPPGERETRHGGKSEGGGEAGERPMEPGLQPAPGKDQERAAGADAQQRQADDHEGEVVPQDDGEQPDEQDLVAEGRRRQKGNRDHDRHGQWPPVKGTKATGSISRVVTLPSKSFSTSTRCWTRKGAPTGITIRAPGRSWATRGGGM